MVPCPSETSEHIAVAQYLGRLPWVLWTHPANGGYRFKSTARMLQRMGASPGCPDILIFTPGPISGRPMAIEMKSTARHASVRPEQKSWLARLSAIGWDAFVCRGALVALEKLRAAGYDSNPKSSGRPHGQNEEDPEDDPGPAAPVARRAESADSLGLGAPFRSCSEDWPRTLVPQEAAARWQTGSYLRRRR